MARILILLTAAGWLAVLAPPTAPLAAQEVTVTEHPLTPPVGHMGLAGANMVMGGLTAAAWRALGGGSGREVLDAFWRGSLGGAAVYGGKVMVSTDPGPALGGVVVFTGRALASAGASASRNAGAGAGLLDDVVLPAGPTRVHVRWREPPGDRVDVSVDVLAIAGLVGAYLLHDDLRLDLPATLASGAPTFRTTRGPGDTWRGRHMAGSIVVLMPHYDNPPAHIPWTEDELMALRHERVHLLQYDQAFILWSDPGERALLRALTGGDRLGRHLDLSLHALVIGGLHGFIPYRWQPWEIEAHSLAGDWGHWAH